jgi:NAD(P)H-dependent FMN reductase
VLALAGSLRRDSYNTKLVRIAAAGATAAGAEVTFVDLAELTLPLYDADIEKASGLPDDVRKLKELFLSHGGLLISSPEYNGSISGALKNAIDWVSRPEEGEGPLAAFDGKVAALLAASPGSLGGLRGLFHLRTILSGIRVLVLPAQFALPSAHEAFDADGKLRDDKKRATAESLGASLVDILRKLYP